MKRIYLPIIAILGFTQVNAQEFNTNDAVRIGTPQLNGTARFNAMGGAFGALGGDVSSLQINPAGSALFNYNNFSITGNLQIQKNKSNYLGRLTEANESDFDLPSFGAVFVVDSKNENQSLKKISIGLGYQTNARFNDRRFSSGISNQSVTNYFLDHANFGFNGGSVPLDLVQTIDNETIGDLYDYLNSIPKDRKSTRLNS